VLKRRLRQGLPGPGWGSSRQHSPRPLVGWGGGHSLPNPHSLNTDIGTFSASFQWTPSKVFFCIEPWYLQCTGRKFTTLNTKNNYVQVKSEQEAQLMLTNPRDSFRGQSKVTKHSNIPYDRCTFLLCNSNFVFKTCVFLIFDFKKCRDLEIRVRGHSRSLKVVPFDRLRMVSY